MSEINKIYESLGISKEVLAYGEHILKALEERFARIDHTAE